MTGPWIVGSVISAVCSHPICLIEKPRKTTLWILCTPSARGGRHEVFLFGIPFDLLGGKLLDSIFSGVWKVWIVNSNVSSLGSHKTSLAQNQTASGLGEIKDSDGLDFLEIFAGFGWGWKIFWKHRTPNGWTKEMYYYPKNSRTLTFEWTLKFDCICQDMRWCTTEPFTMAFVANASMLLGPCWTGHAVSFLIHVRVVKSLR